LRSRRDIKQLSQKFPFVQFNGYEISPQAYNLCKNRESYNIKYKNENIFEENVYFKTLLCLDVLSMLKIISDLLGKLNQKQIIKFFIYRLI